jgi:hypothetical protein
MSPLALIDHPGGSPVWSLWVNRVIRATSSGVCFAPNRDQVGAGNKRRSGPLSAARTRSKSSKPFRRRTTVKSVTDLPIEA